MGRGQFESGVVGRAEALVAEDDAELGGVEGGGRGKGADGGGGGWGAGGRRGLEREG